MGLQVAPTEHVSLVFLIAGTVIFVIHVFNVIIHFQYQMEPVLTVFEITVLHVLPSAHHALTEMESPMVIVCLALIQNVIDVH